MQVMQLSAQVGCMRHGSNLANPGYRAPMISQRSSHKELSVLLSFVGEPLTYGCRCTFVTVCIAGVLKPGSPSRD